MALKEVGMNSRFCLAFFLCGWMILSPISLKAGEDNSIQRPEIRIKELQSRRLQRQLQYQKRQAALQHVSRFMQNTAPYRKFNLKEIKEQYEIKSAALAKVVKSSKLRNRAIVHAKAKALAEVQAMSTVMRARVEAEQRAVVTALRKMKEENPNYEEEALLLATQKAEEQNGEVVTQTEGLPILSKTIDMDYLDSLRRNPTLMPSKITQLPTSSGDKTMPTEASENTDSMPSFVLKPYSQENLKELAQRKAITEYKKRQALQKVSEARRRQEITQAASSSYDRRQKLKELLVLYSQDKISPKEYYERRALVMGTEPTDQ
tara:strand:- start:205 stop:1161 length:957 start_codon:yes stop_codon:yes gene_type:complete